MALTKLAWYDSALVLLTTRPSLAGQPGVPGAAVTLHIINNKGLAGAQTERNLRLFAEYRNAGAAAGDPWFQSGHAWADGRYGEARVVGGYPSGTFNPPLTDWVELGAGSSLPLPELANDQGVKLEVRLDPPADATGEQAEMGLYVETGPAVAAPFLSKVHGDGVYLGIRDDSFLSLTYAGDVTQDDTGPSNDVDVPQVGWLAAGIPFAVDPLEVNIPNATAGKVRIDLVSAGPAGTIIRTAGVEVNPPGSPSNRPAVPADNIPLAYVTKRDTQTVVTADIANVWNVDQLKVYGAKAASGLSITIGPGQALVGDAFMRHDGLTTLFFAASTTSYVWLGRSGSFQVTTTAAPPAEGWMLLYEVVTGVSSVTSIVDRRQYTGFDRLDLILAVPGTIATTSEAHAILPGSRTLYLVPLPAGNPYFSLGTQHSGGSSGNTVADLEADDGAGGAFASLFGVDKPSILHSVADERDLTGRPTDLAVAGGARVRLQIETLPAGGTPGKDATLLTVFAR